VQPLGAAVHKEVGDGELAEIPVGEGLVLLPQPLGDLAHGRAAQQAAPGRVAEGRFDVPRAQAAGERLHRQALQLGRPPRQPGPHARRKRLGPIGHLRNAILDRALGRAQPAPPIAVSVPRAGGGPILVVLAPHRLGHLGLQRFLYDLAHRELEQLRTGVAVGHALAQQLIKLLARPLRCRYSRGHGDASSCRRRQPASLGLSSEQECIPVSLLSKGRPMTARSSGRVFERDSVTLTLESLHGNGRGVERGACHSSRHPARDRWSGV